MIARVTILMVILLTQTTPRVLIYEKAEKTLKIKKKVFILGDSIVKHINSYDISRQIENCRIYVKGFPGAKTECMKDYTPTNNKRKPRPHIDSRWY